jgi:hypothetical protein
MGNGSVPGRICPQGVGAEQQADVVAYRCRWSLHGHINDCHGLRRYESLSDPPGLDRLLGTVPGALSRIQVVSEGQTDL